MGQVDFMRLRAPLHAPHLWVHSGKGGLAGGEYACSVLALLCYLCGSGIDAGRDADGACAEEVDGLLAVSMGTDKGAVGHMAGTVCDGLDRGCLGPQVREERLRSRGRLLMAAEMRAKITGSVTADAAGGGGGRSGGAGRLGGVQLCWL